MSNARTWLQGTAGGLAAGLLIVWVLAALPAGAQRPAIVTVSFGFWVVIGLIDRGSIGAILSWLMPAMTIVLIAHVSGSYLGFHIALGVTTLVIALTFMWEPASRIWARYWGWLVGVSVRAGLSLSERRAYAALMRGILRGPRVRDAAQRLDHRSATARDLRERAEYLHSLEAPDLAWRSVYRRAAEAGLVYADMLEGKRELDFDEAGARVQERDDAMHKLLAARSAPYRWLTYRPFEART